MAFCQIKKAQPSFQKVAPFLFMILRFDILNPLLLF
jgi:hypothetical protein